MAEEKSFADGLRELTKHGKIETKFSEESNLQVQRMAYLHALSEFNMKWCKCKFGAKNPQKTCPVHDF